MTYLDINEGEAWVSIHGRDRRRPVKIVKAPMSEFDMVVYESDIRAYKMEARKFLKKFRKTDG